MFKFKYMMFECKFKINKMKHKFKIMQISIVTWAFYTLQRSAMSHESQVARFESHFCLLLFWTSHLTPLYISVDILKNWQCYLENYKYSRCFHWNYSNRYGKCKFESHFLYDMWKNWWRWEERRKPFSNKFWE